MHSDPKLTDRLRRVATERPLTERVMFGGVAFFCHGHMCCGIYHKLLILRIGEEAAIRAMKRPAVRPMDITGKPMRGWIMVEPDGYQTSRQLKSWIDKAEKFVMTLPRKK